MSRFLGRLVRFHRAPRSLPREIMTSTPVILRGIGVSFPLALSKLVSSYLVFIEFRTAYFLQCCIATQKVFLDLSAQPYVICEVCKATVQVT